LGQYVFGALAYEKHSDIQEWYKKQREYYRTMINDTCKSLRELLPGIIVSRPESSLFSVVDLRNIAKSNFNSFDFVLYCAKEGSIKVGDCFYTLLLAPMSGFYTVNKDKPNPGDMQLRIAYTEPPEIMNLLPYVFCELYKSFEKTITICNYP